MNSSKIEIIAYNVFLYLLFSLFAYAGLQKILNFKNFQIQIAQSPLILKEIIDYVSIMIPAIEVITALMLIFEELRKLGFYIALIMMINFSLYITSLHYLFPNAPCNCGGILGGMKYEVHILFNLFVVFALIWMLRKKSANVNFLPFLF